MTKRKILVISGAAAFGAVFTGELLSFFLPVPQFPGYSRIMNVMSELGSSASPISGIVSAWWIIMGILMIVFAIGFKTAYSPGNKYVEIAFWLLIIYGVGEGIGSGLFKFDMVRGKITISYFIHEVFGAAGIFAVVMLPYVTRRTDKLSASRNFRIFSQIVLLLGFFLLLLFSVRYLAGESQKNLIINGLVKTVGLWQRLMLLVYYIYMADIAVRMVRTAVRPDS